MSESELQVIPCHYAQPRQQPSQQGGVMSIEQVLGNEVFKMMLRDMVDSMVARAHNQQKQLEQEHQSQELHLDVFIEEISETLMLLVKSEASRQIKEAEKFLTELYEHRARQMESRFEELFNAKIQHIDDRILKVEKMNTMEESTTFSALRPPLKNKQVSDLSAIVLQRLDLKSKIIGSSTSIQDHRNSLNLEAISMLSESLNCGDATVERLSDRIKQMEESYRQEFKETSGKIAALRTELGRKLEETESCVKEQLHAGFEGIWNVIANLEKRMVF